MNTHRVPNFTSPLVYFSKSRTAWSGECNRDWDGSRRAPETREMPQRLTTGKPSESIRQRWPAQKYTLT